MSMRYKSIGQGDFQHGTVKSGAVEVVDYGAAESADQTVLLNDGKMGGV